MRLGQAGRPWEFAPVAVQVMRIAPEDAGVRVLLAANLAKLGLRTAALEELERLPSEVRRDATVMGLERAVAALPDDQIGAEELERVCRGNVAALGKRGAGIAPQVEKWTERARGREWFRTADGNVARRVRGFGAWELWGDHRGAAARLAAQHLAEANERGSTYTVEGVDPPWVLLELARALPRRANGGWARVQVVQADAMEFLDGLACADLREVLSVDRVRAYVGEDAAERLRADLHRRRAYSLASAYIPLLNVKKRVEPGIEGVLAQGDAEQAEYEKALVKKVGKVYEGRDRAWWEKRYLEALSSRAGEAAAPPVERLRVLVPTCRFSTYMKHSSADLVEAFRAAGCEAEVLIEPDDSTHFAAGAYLERLAAFKPDLVVLINYTRGQFGDFLPRNLPFVCWIQDALAQQLDASVGAAQGEFDFVVGHLHPELFSLFKYPRARTMPARVVTSARKFHPGPVAAALRERFACEVAMVSHHSETPGAMQARMLGEAKKDPTTCAIVERLFPEVDRTASEPMSERVMSRLDHATREAARAVLGREPGAAAVAQIMRQYCMPMADRVIRHQTLEWAAAVCARRGWRMRAYGRGWDRHPTLAGCAAGEVEHGEELRACYQSAAVQLHASVNTLVHQRVMECALSGGLPLCRLTRDVVSEMWAEVRRTVALSGAESRLDERGRRCVPISDHPELMMAASRAGALGLESGPNLEFTDEWLARVRRDDGEREPAVTAAWLLGDLEAMTFRSEAELEARIEKAIERPQWRSAMGAAVARRVRERLSHDTLVAGVLGLVRRSLEGAA